MPRVVVWFLLELFLFQFAYAEEEKPLSPVQSSAQDPIQNPDESQAKPDKLRKQKGKVTREKEAEGTQAPNRFDADIIFKSKYELNGKLLEVDTD